MASFVRIIGVILLLSTFTFAQESLVFDNETDLSGNFTYQVDPNWIYQSDNSAALLYDNGPAFNVPGGGPVAGSDLSLLENTTLGMSTLGFGAQISASANNRIADDFIIPTGETWTIDSVVFYAYQTSGGIPSTITAVNVRIWDGDPSVSGTVIWGDTSTNVMTNTTFSNIYRHSETSPGTTRAIMQNQTSINTTLGEGTYWIDFQFAGSTSSGPWAPPIAILGTALTGNGLQYIGSTQTWGPAEDLGTSAQQGFPFLIYGSTGGSGGGTFPEILYYKFDEAGSDSTENFAVPGSGFDYAQVIGAHTLGSTGQFGAALVAGGGTGAVDYVNTGWITDLGASDWTISLWLNDLLDVTNLNYIFGDNTAGSFRCFYNGVAPTGGIILRGPSMTDVGVTGVQPGPSVVHFVYDSSVPEIRAYLNGAFQINVVQAAPLNINGTAPFKVAGYSSSSGMEAGGLLDEFRFYNRALDSAEVASTWNITIIPVELTSFTASVNNNDVTLNWATASELNNNGFQVERKSNGEFEPIGFVPGFGTTSETKTYSFSDANLNPGVYSYRLKQIDYDGSFEYSDPVEVTIIVPDVYSLHQNYPNPFNPTTKITFTLAANANVTLKVFDILGQEVMTLINNDLTAGVHNYDFDAASFNSGVYFYRIEANGVDGSNFTNVKKMILLK